MDFRHSIAATEKFRQFLLQHQVELEKSSIEKVVDPRDYQGDEWRDFGGAARAENGEFHFTHVTGEPDELLEKARQGQLRVDLDSRAYRVLDELGTGLYSSTVPHYWEGRVGKKWGFLDRLTKEQIVKLTAALRQYGARDERPPTLQDKSYLSSNEQGFAERILDQVERGVLPPTVLVALADQPFNIRFAAPEFLQSIGIRPAGQPEYVKFVTKGQLAFLGNYPTLQELKWMREFGLCGAMMPAGFATNPQVVIWDQKCIVSAEKIEKGVGSLPDGMKYDQTGVAGRVLRGSCWFLGASNCTSAFRHGYDLSERGLNGGFRPSLKLEMATGSLPDGAPTTKSVDSGDRFARHHRGGSGYQTDKGCRKRPASMQFGRDDWGGFRPSLTLETVVGAYPDGRSGGLLDLARIRRGRAFDSSVRHEKRTWGFVWEEDPFQGVRPSLTLNIEVGSLPDGSKVGGDPRVLNLHLCRGGGWVYPGENSRASKRTGPRSRSSWLGLRVGLTLATQVGSWEDGSKIEKRDITPDEQRRINRGSAAFLLLREVRPWARYRMRVWDNNQFIGFRPVLALGLRVGSLPDGSALDLPPNYPKRSRGANVFLGLPNLSRVTRNRAMAADVNSNHLLGFRPVLTLSS